MAYLIVKCQAFVMPRKFHGGFQWRIQEFPNGGGGAQLIINI